MKTITENGTNLSKYLFDDDKPVSIQSDRVNVGDPDSLDLVIGDLNSGNCTLYENVTDAPADWHGCKYTYDGTAWAQHPDWVDPDAE